MTTNFSVADQLSPINSASVLKFVHEIRSTEDLIAYLRSSADRLDERARSSPWDSARLLHLRARALDAANWYAGQAGRAAR